MEHIIPDSPAAPQLLADTPLAFTPVPQVRRRRDGWTDVQQRRFISALEVMGAVGPAARAVGMGRASAYRLRERTGAQSFARAWDVAIDMGRERMFDYAMERALDGVTTVRVLRGGSISVSAGPDMKMVHAVLRDPPPPFAPRSPARNIGLKATKETVFR
jgi:hypothetical protein